MSTDTILITSGTGVHEPMTRSALNESLSRAFRSVGGPVLPAPPVADDNRPWVYLAGPMRGLPAYNFVEFWIWEQVLEAAGLRVWSPARNDCTNYELLFDSKADAYDAGVWLMENIGESFDLRRAIREDLDFITEHATAVYVLPGWETSSGVRAEKATAECIGVQVFALVGSPEEWSAVPLPKTGEPVLYEQTPVNYSPGEVRTVSSTGGEKGTKLARFDLIPVGPLTRVAEHFGRGARKYADHNWRRGYEWSKSYAALLRHLTAFWDGEDIDEETGSKHITAAAWHAMALDEFSEHYPEFDDRYKGRPSAD